MVMNFSYLFGLLFYIISVCEADFHLQLDFDNFECPEGFDFIHCRYNYQVKEP